MSSELITINPQAALPQIYNEEGLVEIRKDRSAFPRYRDITIKDRCNWLYLKLAYCSTMLHLDRSAKQLTIDAGELDKGIMKCSLNDLTLPEISTAMENGARGEYGKTYGLTCQEVLGHLWQFVDENKSTYLRLASERHKEARKNKNQDFIDRVEAHRLQCLQEQALNDIINK